MDLRDILCSLEMAEAQLCDDIKFLNCLASEYLIYEKPRESAEYLYQQLSTAIITVTKSMEYNQKEMRQAIEKYYENRKKEREVKNNGNTSK